MQHEEVWSAREGGEGVSVCQWRSRWRCRTPSGIISDTVGQESTWTLTFEEDCDFQCEVEVWRGEEQRRAKERQNTCVEERDSGATARLQDLEERGGLQVLRVNGAAQWRERKS